MELEIDSSSQDPSELQSGAYREVARYRQGALSCRGKSDRAQQHHAQANRGSVHRASKH